MTNTDNASLERALLTLQGARARYAQVRKDYCLKGAKPVPSRLRLLLEAHAKYEKAFAAVISVHQKGEVIEAYRQASIAFFGYLQELKEQVQNPRDKQFKEKRDALFQTYRQAKLAYAAAGLLLVSDECLATSTRPVSDGYACLLDFLL